MLVHNEHGTTRDRVTLLWELHPFFPVGISEPSCFVYRFRTVHLALTQISLAVIELRRGDYEAVA